jgi:hypothetical protein
MVCLQSSPWGARPCLGPHLEALYYHRGDSASPLPLPRCFPTFSLEGKILLIFLETRAACCQPAF